MRNSVILLVVIPATFLVAPTLAASGTTVDDLGKPVQAARACLISEGRPLLCVETDANGYYTLPDVNVNAVRITRTGYLPANVAAVAQEAPIVLTRAASLRVRVLDAATGEPIGGGKIVVAYPSGRVIDELPFSRGGTHVATLPAGLTRVRAWLDGFTSESVEVELEAGKESKVDVKVRKEP